MPLTDRPVLVCGEVLMDVFPAQATAGGLQLDARIGGSPWNVAMALARLGRPVEFVAAVSHDPFGDRIWHALGEEGVGRHHVTRVPAPTTLSIVGTNDAGDPSYTFHGAQGADRMLPHDAADAVPGGVAALHVGSYATVVEPIAQVLRQLVTRLRGETLVSADPNVRLTVEPDPRRWVSTYEWLTSVAHMVKVSVEDLTVIAPGRTPLQAAEAALGHGVRLFVVTRGQAGAEAWTPWEHVSVPVAPVRIVDTVGAGDTFQAALLDWVITRGARTPAALAEMPRADLEGALRWAARAAAITCGRRGADPPRRAELRM